MKKKSTRNANLGIVEGKARLLIEDGYIETAKLLRNMRDEIARLRKIVNEGKQK